MELAITPPIASRRSWLLLSIRPEERIYRGNDGYEDLIRTVYHYDSSVQNHIQVKSGDLAVIRGKREVYGSAVIVDITVRKGTKRRLRCPSCTSTKFIVRHSISPKFRCRRGHTFHEAIVVNEACRLFEAHFGDTFAEFSEPVTIDELVAIAPRFNKQLSMVELDTSGVIALLHRVANTSSYTQELPPAVATSYPEGQLSKVAVNRWERSAPARAACLAHFGARCLACSLDFRERYGDIGAGVIEVHHIQPLAQTSSVRTVDPIRDLVPLCPNCHTIAHRRNPPLTVTELRELLQSNSPSID